MNGRSLVGMGTDDRRTGFSETMNTNLGRINLRLGRVLNHGGKISQSMVVYLFFRDLKNSYGVSMWWMFTAIPLMYLVHWFDKKYIYPNENDLSARENPFMVGLERKLDKVLEILGGKK